MNPYPRVLAVLEIVTSIGLVIFWTMFFTIGLAPVSPPPCYFTFENSFPVPDLILAVGFLIAGILLLKKSPKGRTLSLVCAGALMFLGVLDTSFNVQNGMYTISVGDTISNAFINLWCIGFGGVVVYRIMMTPS
ncbi:MAG: hypothetical protein QNJ97_05425 [Myxococcota bacterium]|nr:hypothetical protein [Myxococcota bacterium]